MKESISTKELIRDTLQKLLEEKDYAEISMKEIAKSANVGRRTLYRYFGTKDDIVRFMQTLSWMNSRTHCFCRERRA